MNNNYTIDRHAIRFGEQPSGWIIILEWDSDVKESNVNNKLFLTLDSAEKHAKTIADCYKVTIKALRAEERVSQGKRTLEAGMAYKRNNSAKSVVAGWNACKDMVIGGLTFRNPLTHVGKQMNERQEMSKIAETLLDNLMDRFKKEVLDYVNKDPYSFADLIANRSPIDDKCLIELAEFIVQSGELFARIDNSLFLAK